MKQKKVLILQSKQWLISFRRSVSNITCYGEACPQENKMFIVRAADKWTFQLPKPVGVHVQVR